MRYSIGMEDDTLQMMRTKIRRNGQRMMPQREAVYQVLSTLDHPTVDALFLATRPRLQGLSLATVYNTLELLADCGLVSKLTGNGPARYEAMLAPHGHLRCRHCNAVEDLPPFTIAGAIGHLPIPEGFTVQAVSLTVEGTCARCANSPALQAE